MTIRELVRSAPASEMVEALVAAALNSVGDVAKAIMFMDALKPTGALVSGEPIAVPLVTELTTALQEGIAEALTERVARMKDKGEELKRVQEDPVLGPVYEAKDDDGFSVN